MMPIKNRTKVIGAVTVPNVMLHARVLVAALCAVALFTGCSGQQDPGPGTDERRPAAQPSAAESPALPVAGSFVWQDGGYQDQPQIPQRVAVHALRRTPTATILDWSVTVLPGEGRLAGERVDSGVGSRADGHVYDQGIDLLDRSGNVYRPLQVSAKPGAPCVCRTYYPFTDLNVGEPAIFQVAFPPLPPDVQDIDIAFGGGFVIPRVAVTPEGQVPTMAEPVELARPADPLPVLAKTDPFPYPQRTTLQPNKQRLSIAVNRVEARSTGTSVWWTVTAEESGEGLDVNGSGPVGDPELPPLLLTYKSSTADGPALVPGANADAPRLRASYTTMAVNRAGRGDGTPPTRQQCRCTDYQSISGPLENDGGSMVMVTDYPPLPPGTTTVAMSFPSGDVPPLPNLPVTSASVMTQGPPTAGPGTTWEYKGTGMPPFRASEWPTPVPSEASLAGRPAYVDKVVRRTDSDGLRAEEEQGGTTLVVDSTVLFSSDSAQLRPQARATIERIAQKLQADAAEGATVTVTGYVAGTDAGSKAVQQRLSGDRATAVQKALDEAVEKELRWNVVAKGAGDPVAPNDNEANRRLNRRVTIAY